MALELGKNIWKVKIPFRVACFNWLLAREVVLTHDNLSKRNVNLCSKCYMCGEETETISHLFLKGDPAEIYSDNQENSKKKTRSEFLCPNSSKS